MLIQTEFFIISLAIYTGKQLAQIIKSGYLRSSCGSVIGAVVGGMLVGILPASVLKIGLGIILNISAWRIFRHHAAN